MKDGFKKVLPEDVYVSIYPIEELVQAADGTVNKHPKCPNKISGVEFMDMFASYVWDRPRGTHKYYAAKMKMDVVDFGQTVKGLSGIYVQEWRDRYLNMAACELLRDSELSITNVARKLGFSDVVVFGRFFLRHNGTRPLSWRYNERGCNASIEDIRHLRMKKAGLSYKVDKRK